MTKEQHPANSAGDTTTPPGVMAAVAAPTLSTLGPVTANDPIELDLAKGAVKMLAVAAVPVMAFATLTMGSAGALSAGIAIAVVVGMYLISGGLLSFAAKLGPGALMAAALGGFAMRLMIYALLMVLLRPVEAIHGPTLAISAAVLIVGSLIWEARLVSRTPNLLWIDAAAALPRPVQDHPAPSPQMTRTPA